MNNGFIRAALALLIVIAVILDTFGAVFATQMIAVLFDAFLSQVTLGAITWALWAVLVYYAYEAWYHLMTRPRVDP